MRDVTREVALDAQKGLRDAKVLWVFGPVALTSMETGSECFGTTLHVKLPFYRYIQLTWMRQDVR